MRYDAKPSGIAVDAGGKPWFVEEDPGNPGYRIGTYSGTGTHYDEFSVAPCEATNPCSGSFSGTGLTDLAIGPDGGIWFTNVINHKFGRFDPDTHQMVQYTMASLGLGFVVLCEGTAAFTYLFVLARRRTVPGRIPLVGGRRMPPWLVVPPLLAPIGILATFNQWSLQYIFDGFSMPPEVAEGIPGWSFWGQVVIFWIWGVSLTAATLTYAAHHLLRRRA